MMAALREEVDRAYEAAYDSEARTLARLRFNTWCPTEEQVNACRDAAKFLVDNGCNGYVPEGER